MVPHDEAVTTIGGLTPVHRFERAFVKRDDLYRPFRDLGINGSKLRQCMATIRARSPKTLLTYGSIHSPQIGLVAACGRLLCLPTEVLVGGKRDTRYTDFARAMGAHVLRCPCARHPALLGAALRHARGKRSTLLIRTGMIDPGRTIEQLSIGAAQVANVPPRVTSLVITGGSGLTAASVVLGLALRKRSRMRVHVVETGYSCAKFVERVLAEFFSQSGVSRLRLPALRFWNLPNISAFRYERLEPFSPFGLQLHPQYEAKAFRFALASLNLDSRRSLYWIAGSDYVGI